MKEPKASYYYEVDVAVMRLGEIRSETYAYPTWDALQDALGGRIPGQDNLWVEGAAIAIRPVFDSRAKCILLPPMTPTEALKLFAKEIV